MDITPKPLTLNQLFSSKNEQFVVPSYQRRYAWRQSHTKALFDDIKMLLDGDGHLLGTIILHSTTHHGGLNKPEVVDGQQRITTLLILFKAIEQQYVKRNLKSRTEDIGPLLLCKDYDEKTEDKVLLGDLDQDDFKKIMKLNLKNIKNEYLINAYKDFSKWLDELDDEHLNKFYYKLMNDTIVLRLDVGLPKDAYKLFETINNRGLRLTPTDIIKNFLLGHAAKLDDMQRLDKVKKLWTDIIVNLDKIDTDDFLRQYMCAIYKRKISFNGLVKAFKTYYLNNIQDAELLGEFTFFAEEKSDEINGDNKEDYKTNIKIKKTTNQISIEEFLDNILKISAIYRKMIKLEFDNDEINRHFKNLQYILSKPSYIFLMKVVEIDVPKNDLINLLKLIETFMLRRHICKRQTGELDLIFSKLVGFIKNNKIDIKEIKKALAKDMPNDSDFIKYIPEHEFKGRLINRAKYMLAQIEYHLTGSVGEKFLSLGNEVHLEHIIPETITTKKSKEEFGDWETYLGDDAKEKHKKYVNLIGNMTLLACTLNIVASNNPFSKKKKSYKKSEIKITNDLAMNRDFKFKNVDKRNFELSEIALKIWKF